jgi:predicted TIM-barrel fold metal-dependent hydrolase
MAALPGTAQARHSGSGLPFPLFDAHLSLRSEDRVHYTRAPLPQPQSGEEPEVVRVLRWMDQNGVAAGAAIQPVATYGVDNRYLLDSTDQYSRRLVPIAALDAEDPATPDTVRRLIAQHGLAGVRLSGPRSNDGTSPWLDSQAAHRTWAAANEASLVMDLSALSAGPAPALLAKYGRLAAQYPRARLVLDHCGWPAAAGAPEFGLGPPLRALLAWRNIYFKVTTANLEAWRLANVPARDALRYYAHALGTDRLLWGSDIGNSPGSYAEMVARIVAATAGLSRRDRQRLLQETGESVIVAGGRH